MGKAKFERTKPHCNIGTIGHVDHGKTTLTAAITHVQALKGMATDISYDQVAKASESQGRAVYSMQFSRYDTLPAAVAEEVVAKSKG